MQDPQTQVTTQQEQDLRRFSKSFFRFLAKKHGPNGEVRTVRSELSINVEKAACLIYQLIHESAEEVCRKKFPSSGDTEINSFVDWLYDTILENYSYPNIFSSLFASAIFVHVAVLFGKSRGYRNHSDYAAELWLKAFTKCFGNELFRNGGWIALDQESEKSARFYDGLIQIYPTGVFDVEELRQKTINGQSLFNYLYHESASKKTPSRRARRRERNSKAKEDLTSKDLRKIKQKLNTVVPDMVESLRIMKTPPELINEGFPPEARPTEAFYRLLLRLYHKGELSKKGVMREYENFNREVEEPDELRGMELRELPGAREDSDDSLDPEKVISPRSKIKGAFSKRSLAKVEVPDELRGMELGELPGAREDSFDPEEVLSPRKKTKGASSRKSLTKVKLSDELRGMELGELPGAREDSDDSLDLDKIPLPTNKKRGACVKKSLAKPKFCESVLELTAGVEKMKLSAKSITKVEADQDETESATDVASNEAKCSDDSEDPDDSGESSQEETKKQRSRKSGGGKKKKGKGKKKKKKHGK